LTEETAIKAKNDGVKQFIYMSSAIVYGDSSGIGKSKIITRDTVPAPANCYGDSKLQAENRILPLNNADFKVVILRPPMIYGKGCKGNYAVLAKYAQKLPMCPYIKNERSMLYIDNLCEFVRLMVQNNEHSVFWPQNSEYVCTSEMVRDIAAAHNKKIRLLKGFGWALKLLGQVSGIVNKAFGSLVYEKEMSCYKEKYVHIDLEKSIAETELEQ